MTANLKTIDFYGEAVFLVFHPETGKPFVPVKPLCGHLGTDWKSQHRKLTSDVDLWGAEDMTIPSPGGPQVMTCIPLENLHAWLLGIQTPRVKEEIRPKLRRYQKELFQVLHAYETTGAAIRPEVRAAASQATRALFDEIEALTGLNPEAAQPGDLSLQDWQLDRAEARQALADHVLAQVAGGSNKEKAIARLVEDSHSGRLSPEMMDLVRRANARAGEHRTTSRRTMQRILHKVGAGESLAPKACSRPDPDWLEDLLAQAAQSPSLAEAQRRLREQNPDGPSYDAVRRAVAKVQQRQGMRIPIQRELSAAVLKEIRTIYGHQGARVVLWQRFGFPDPGALPESIETGEGGAR
jgi:hypothetical protein